MLPPNLPSSVEGEIGYIRYTASVVFDVPFWINNLFDEPFTVTKEVDLNDVPLFRVINNFHHFSSPHLNIIIFTGAGQCGRK